MLTCYAPQSRLDREGRWGRSEDGCPVPLLVTWPPESERVSDSESERERG